MYPKGSVDPRNCFLENCLKLEVSKVENHVYKRAEIIKALKDTLKNEDFLKIDMVSMYGSNLVWIISFKEMSIARKYFGFSVKIQNTTCFLENAHNTNLYSVFRICWLPNLFPLELVKRYFETYGTVVKCFHELSREEGCQGIKTGIVQVKIMQTRDQADSHPVKAGPQRHTCGVRMLVMRAGEQTGCFKCGEASHKAKDCPKNRKPVSYADITANQLESNDGQIDADAEHALEQVQPAEMEVVNGEQEVVAVETLNENQHSTMIEAPPTNAVKQKKAKRKEMTSPSESDQNSKQGRQDASNESYEEYSTLESSDDSSTDEEIEDLNRTVSKPPDNTPGGDPGVAPPS